MVQALKSPLRIPALDHGIAESVDDLVVGTDDSRIAAKSLDQCWLVVDAKLAVESSLHRFSRSQLPKGFKALSISHVLEVCSLQAPAARRPGGSSICRAFAAVGYMPRRLGRFWIVCTQDEKNRGLTGGLKARIGLLSRVRCLRSLISANTPRRIFPWREAEDSEKRAREDQNWFDADLSQKLHRILPRTILTLSGQALEVDASQLCREARARCAATPPSRGGDAARDTLPNIWWLIAETVCQNQKLCIANHPTGELSFLSL